MTASLLVTGILLSIGTFGLIGAPILVSLLMIIASVALATAGHAGKIDPAWQSMFFGVLGAWFSYVIVHDQISANSDQALYFFLFYPIMAPMHVALLTPAWFFLRKSGLPEVAVMIKICFDLLTLIVATPFLHEVMSEVIRLGMTISPLRVVTVTLVTLVVILHSFYGWYLIREKLINI